MDKFIGILFITLPYMSLSIFIFGTIYRYFYHGYKVTSLSSQIFESKLLYWGSHSFHIGILLLFVGHFIGFLFPSTLLAFGKIPARIIPIEIGALACAFLSIFGLFTLLLRRLTIPAILKLTSTMDILIYTVLIVEVILGILVALLYKWGLLWFASSLAPYLLSIFTFSPDISAVVDMPMLIQMHVILAYILVAMWPFTRLMHFLVYPFGFLTRATQIYIWNRNPKTHRKSDKMFEGKVPTKN